MNETAIMPKELLIKMQAKISETGKKIELLGILSKHRLMFCGKV
jgi:hypothetical protein